eukprot:756424-Pelagomonas_calceolata.AAC.1
MPAHCSCNLALQLPLVSTAAPSHHCCNSPICPPDGKHSFRNENQNCVKTLTMKLVPSKAGIPEVMMANGWPKFIAVFQLFVGLWMGDLQPDCSADRP